MTSITIIDPTEALKGDDNITEAPEEEITVIHISEEGNKTTEFPDQVISEFDTTTSVSDQTTETPEEEGDVMGDNASTVSIVEGETTDTPEEGSDIDNSDKDEVTEDSVTDIPISDDATEETFIDTSAIETTPKENISTGVTASETATESATSKVPTTDMIVDITTKASVTEPPIKEEDVAVVEGISTVSSVSEDYSTDSTATEDSLVTDVAINVFTTEIDNIDDDFTDISATEPAIGVTSTETAVTEIAATYEPL